MKKIVHINCATSGSTGKIIGDIAFHTAPMGYEHVLCAPGKPGTQAAVRYICTSLPYEQGLYRRLCNVTGFQYGFAPISTAKILDVLKKERPDLVHIHCVNGFMVNVYKLFAFIKKHKLPVVITNHAEFFYTGSCPHAYDCNRWKEGCGSCPQGFAATHCKLGDKSAAAHEKMREAFAGLEQAAMVSVSPWVGSRAAASPITAHIPQQVVLNGVNTQLFCLRDKYALRKELGIEEADKVIFHPTAYFSDSEQDSKGGRFLLKLAQMLPNYRFIVAGTHHAELKVPENVQLLGRVADQKLLAKYYALADVTVVTGKRETFNMPVAESLCSGTPVVGFLAGGPESIAIEDYCNFCEYGNVQHLRDVLLHTLDQTWDTADIAQQAALRYDAAVMACGYEKVYKRLLHEKEVRHA